MGSYKKQKLDETWGDTDDGGWGDSSTTKAIDDGWGGGPSKSSSFGGGGGGGSKCYNCQQTGHMSRDCPQPRAERSGGGGGGSKCYNCQQTGHMSRDCPQPKAERSGGGGGSKCYNCQQTGHMSRDCPQPRAERSGGSGGGGWGNTLKSGDSGWGDSSKVENKDNGGWGASSATNTNDDGWGGGASTTQTNDDGGWGGGASKSSSFGGSNGGGGGSKCYNCQQTGHMSRDCPQPKAERSGGGGGGSKCYNCQQTGHMSRDCPQPKAERSGGGGGGGWGNSSKSEKSADAGWGESAKTEKADDGGWGDSSEGCESRKRPREGCDKPDEDRPAPYRPEEIDLDEEAKFNQTEEGEHFEHYCDQAVTCVPPGIVKPISAFSDVITSELLLSHLEKANYKRMTPIQKWAMPALLGGLDIIGCAQTGSGKTAAFTVPVIQTLLNDSKNSELPSNVDQDLQEPSCLIIAPTRELARQLHGEALKWSRDTVVKCHVIYGGITTGHLKAQISRGCNLLVSTPGRLKDFVNRNWIGFKNIKYIILDEGDRLIDDGFIVDIKEILAHESMPPQEQRQILFFSATFKPETQKVARELMGNKFVFITVGRVGSANTNITQEFVKVSRAEKKRELKKILGEVPEDQKTIIFTQTKAAADMLAGYFTALNLSATSIHGDRHQQQREEAIRQFRRGERRFLISSPVGNRGLDLPKVYLVINYDLPNNIDEYVHRIGRTGRAGHPGKAISFYDEEKDTEILSDLIALLKEVNQSVPDFFTSSGDTTANGGGDGGWGETDPANVPADSGAVDEEW